MANKKNCYTSNAEWTKIPPSKEGHSSYDAAHAVCMMLIGDYGNGMPECSVRGTCTRAWVEKVKEQQ